MPDSFYERTELVTFQAEFTLLSLQLTRIRSIAYFSAFLEDLRRFNLPKIKLIPFDAFTFRCVRTLLYEFHNEYDGGAVREIFLTKERKRERCHNVKFSLWRVCGYLCVRSIV